MKRGVIRGVIALGIVGMLAALCACAGAQPSTAKKASSMFNTTPYGDARNTSYLPVVGALGSELKWKRVLEDVDLTGEPMHLAYVDGKVIAHFPLALESFDPATGAVDWHRPTSPSFLFSLNGDGVATVDANAEYTVLAFDGRPGMQTLLPIGSTYVRLLAADRVKDELRYVFSTAPSPVNAPDMDSEVPTIGYHRLAYDTEDLRWEFLREDSPLTRMEAGDGTVYLVGARGVNWFAADASSDGDVNTYDGALFQAASLDFQDRLLVVVLTDDGRELRCVDQGKLVWSDSLGDEVLGSQPPASGPEGGTYLMLDRQLVHWQGGQRQWMYDLPPGQANAFFSVLSDGSVLLAVGQTLVRVAANGVEMTRVLLDAPATCRPLMTKEGFVLVGTATGINCYR